MQRHVLLLLCAILSGCLICSCCSTRPAEFAVLVPPDAGSLHGGTVLVCSPDGGDGFGNPCTASVPLPQDGLISTFRVQGTTLFEICACDFTPVQVLVTETPVTNESCPGFVVSPASVRLTPQLGACASTCDDAGVPSRCDGGVDGGTTDSGC
jgi:hypothetical protein